MMFYLFKSGSKDLAATDKIFHECLPSYSNGVYSFMFQSFMIVNVKQELPCHAVRIAWHAA